MSTDPATLNALASEVEAGSAPDRDLDARVWEATHPDDWLVLFGTVGAQDYVVNSIEGGTLALPPFTASVDAAPDPLQDERLIDLVERDLHWNMHLGPQGQARAVLALFRGEGTGDHVPHGRKMVHAEDGLCSDCPHAGYPTEHTRCAECPRRRP